MSRIMYVQPSDVVGDPQPALIVNAKGEPASANGAQPASWVISCLVPGGPFVDHLLNTDEPRAGATVMSEDREIAALVVVLQLGRWQHRVIVPLLGTTVSTYLAALKTTGMPVGLELSAQDLPQAKRCDVQLSEERLSEALDAHRYVVEDCSIMSYRRALGRHCIVMANPSAIPGHPAEKWVQTVSVGRVWPPELPFPGVGSYAWSKKVTR